MYVGDIDRTKVYSQYAAKQTNEMMSVSVQPVSIIRPFDTNPRDGAAPDGLSSSCSFTDSFSLPAEYEDFATGTLLACELLLLPVCELCAPLLVLGSAASGSRAAAAGCAVAAPPAVAWADWPICACPAVGNPSILAAAASDMRSGGGPSSVMVSLRS